MKGSETDVPVHGEAGDYARIRERVGWRLHRRAARHRDETVSIDTITVLCPQYGSTWEVQGSKGAVYTVQLYADGALASCDCPSYKFLNGDEWDPTCKHITAVWKHGCLFNPQWHDAGPNDYAQHGIRLATLHPQRQHHEPCPGCGADMIAVRIAV
jgi:uncharacterized Zn finger protein